MAQHKNGPAAVRSSMSGYADKLRQSLCRADDSDARIANYLTAAMRLPPDYLYPLDEPRMPATASNFPPTARPDSEGKDGYMPIPPGVLRWLDHSKLDIFRFNASAQRYVLFRDASLKLGRKRIEALAEGPDNTLYVRAAEFEGVCGQVLQSLENFIEDESLSHLDRYQMLQTAASIEVERSLQKLSPDNYIALSHRLGGQISTLLEGNAVLPHELYAIARHDSFTFTHVTNVTAYAIMLAELLGVSDPTDLNEIAGGAMLHDIGKRFIPHSILTKPGRLTPEEREIVQRHPQDGYEELHGRDDVTHAQRMMVYQHHERVDGTGYPVRITGSDMHFYARILAVVDVFDAVTGSRPYRSPMKYTEAIALLEAGAGTHFDKQVAQCWIAAVKSK